MTLFYSPKGSLATRCTILATTGATAVYTASPGQRPVIHTINLTNVTPSAVVTTIALYKDADSSTTSILHGISLSAASRTTIDNIPISMMDGDEIRVTAATADAVHVIVIASEGMGASN